MAMTAYAQKRAGDHLIAKLAFAMPSDVSLGLFSASPGENGSLVSEFTGGSYIRKGLTAAMGAFATVNGIATAVNTSAITFPANTVAHGLNLYGGIIDVSTLGTGNVLFYAPWENPIIINNGDPAVVIPVGALTIKIVGSVLAMISSYAANKSGDHLIGKNAFAMPAGVFHGLLASNPTVAGTMSSEVGVGGYGRQPLTAAMSVVDASSGIASNTDAINYPDPEVDYPGVNYSFVADAASAGNLLFANQLPETLTIRNNGAPAVFAAGSIRLKIE